MSMNSSGNVLKFRKVTDLVLQRKTFLRAKCHASSFKLTQDVIFRFLVDTVKEHGIQLFNDR